MRRTDEQRQYTAFLEAQTTAARLHRARIVPDSEGFPILPGQYGQVEYYGAEWQTGEQRLCVSTKTRGMVLG